MKDPIDEQEHGKKKDARNDDDETKPVITDQKGGKTAGGRENRKNGQNLLHEKER